MFESILRYTLLSMAILQIVSCNVRSSTSDTIIIKRERRSVGDVGKALLSAVSIGTSLIGKTLKDIMDDSAVAVAGQLDNYSKWSLNFIDCDIEDGEVNVPMTSVLAGTREGFASHKKIGVYGTSVRCSFLVNSYDNKIVGNRYIHFMYDVPWDVGFTKHNRLAIAVCSESTSNCKDLSYADMSEENYSFMKRSTYKDLVANMMQCTSGICISGTMGTSFKSEIKLHVYPESYSDLAPLIRDKMELNGISSYHYSKYLHTEKKLSVISGATSRQAWSSFAVLLFSLVICLVQIIE